jgi:hypothetical protein
MQNRHAFLRVGERAFRVQSFSGAEPFAEVVNELGGFLPYAKKRLGAVRYDDLEAKIGFDADAELFKWIGDAWFGSPIRKDVAFDALNPVHRVASTLEMKAQLHEVILPGLDLAAHDERFMTVRIAPIDVRRRPGGSVIIEPHEGGRELYAHSFLVEIDGLDCTGVQAVDPIAVRSRLPVEQSGSGLLVFPDVHLHVAAEKVHSFRDWFDDFVLGGNNDDDKERAGRIVFYDPLLKFSLATLELHHIGIYRMHEEGRGGRVQVDLYCERMELTTPPPL